MSKKILNVTIMDYANIGNRLQNYAVYRTLEKYGVETKDEIRLWKNIAREILKMLPGWFPFLKRRYRLFLKFSSNISMIHRNIDFENYKFIFYGSDQIWNPEFGHQDCIAPDSPKKKNVALSASIGSNYIPKERLEEYREGLLKFQYISVREERAAELVDELIGVKPEVLIDPTLSLSKEEWIKVEKRPCFKKIKSLENKKYILLYFLGKMSPERSNAIQNLAEKLKAQIVDLTCKDIAKATGPSEFTWLIHHSSMVITDSYHGSIFSFIFDKPFYILDREGDWFTMSMNSRFDTLFQKFGLYDRKSNDIVNYTEQHDYTQAYVLLKKERKKYFAFIYHIMEEKNR